MAVPRLVRGPGFSYPPELNVLTPYLPRTIAGSLVAVHTTSDRKVNQTMSLANTPINLAGHEVTLGGLLYSNMVSMQLNGLSDLKITL
jgi:hypothetical protein